MAFKLPTTLKNNFIAVRHSKDLVLSHGCGIPCTSTRSAYFTLRHYPEHPCQNQYFLKISPKFRDIFIQYTHCKPYGHRIRHYDLSWHHRFSLHDWPACGHKDAVSSLVGCVSCLISLWWYLLFLLFHHCPTFLSSVIVPGHSSYLSTDILIFWTLIPNYPFLHFFFVPSFVVPTYIFGETTCAFQ